MFALPLNAMRPTPAGREESRDSSERRPVRSQGGVSAFWNVTVLCSRLCFIHVPAKLGSSDSDPTFTQTQESDLPLACSGFNSIGMAAENGSSVAKSDDMIAKTVSNAIVCRRHIHLVSRNFAVRR
jgi:hypothetical protein